MSPRAAEGVLVAGMIAALGCDVRQPDEPTDSRWTRLASECGGVDADGECRGDRL